MASSREITFSKFLAESMAPTTPHTEGRKACWSFMDMYSHATWPHPWSATQKLAATSIKQALVRSVAQLHKVGVCGRFDPELIYFSTIFGPVYGGETSAGGPESSDHRKGSRKCEDDFLVCAKAILALHEASVPADVVAAVRSSIAGVPGFISEREAWLLFLQTAMKEGKPAPCTLGLFRAAHKLLTLCPFSNADELNEIGATDAYWVGADTK